jgi:hypothetical protein
VYGKALSENAQWNPPMTGIFERRFCVGKYKCIGPRFHFGRLFYTARIETESYDVTNRIAGFSRRLVARTTDSTTDFGRTKLLRRKMQGFEGDRSATPRRPS